MAKLEYVEGIGPVYSGKLKEAGIPTTEALLEAGKTRAGREALAQKADISPKLILEWVNHADLMRVIGVGSEYADLLEAAGVDTVVELATRVPANLTPRMQEVNADKKLVRRLPSLSMVTDWIRQAKDLPRVVEY